MLSQESIQFFQGGAMGKKLEMEVHGRGEEE